MQLKIVTTLLMLSLALSASAQKPNYKRSFEQAIAQTQIMLAEIGQIQQSGLSKDLVSPRTLDKGKLKMVASKDWTSGFFPGVLWFIYEFDNSRKWLDLAKDFTSPIEQEKLNSGTHDMGFKVFCSVGAGYRLTKDSHYKDVILESANTLIKRYNPKTGVIRSWHHNTDKWVNPVIIDNMMNLELLFEATRLSGDSSFHKIAVSHANVTMQNHFRPDHSSYHVIDYDPKTGKVLKKNTHQGYSHESAWSRGQAWALYGYTMCYRYTRDPRYLKQAEQVASYILSHPNLPKDLVPYWDFNAPGIPNEPRDVSAAAVIASALYELSDYSNYRKRYLKKANVMLHNLAKNYVSPAGANKGFILAHSTGSRPANSEIDVPLSYADYYYLEALLRYKSRS